MKHLPLLLLLAVVLLTVALLTAGCITGETPAAPAPATTAVTASPTTAIPDNDRITLDIITLWQGADVIRELGPAGAAIPALEEGTTAYLLEVTVTCEQLGKHSRREGYIGSVSLSDTNIRLCITSGTDKTFYPATHLLPLPENYHGRMLYDDITLREGESLSRWILYTGIPETGTALLTLQKNGCDAEEVPLP